MNEFSKSWIKHINQDREEINVSHHIFNSEGRSGVEEDIEKLERLIHC